MTSVHEVAVALGRGLARSSGQEKRAAVLAYGLEILLGAVLEIAVILVLARLLGWLAPAAWTLAAACSLRLLSGGSHCTAYYRCLWLSVFVFLSLGGAAQLLATVLPALPLSLASMTALLVAGVIVWRLAPVAGAVEIRLKPAVRRRRRFYSLACVGAWVVVLVLAAGEKTWSAAVCLGLLWQAFSLTVWGRSFVRAADRLLTFGRGR